mgnify:CR=1 FL=1
MYVAVKGGEQAINNAHRLLADRRRGERDQAELSVAQIQSQLRLAVDRVMAEASLYDPELAALALQHAQQLLGLAIALALLEALGPAEQDLRVAIARAPRLLIGRRRAAEVVDLGEGAAEHGPERAVAGPTPQAVLQVLDRRPVVSEGVQHRAPIHAGLGVVAVEADGLVEGLAAGLGVTALGQREAQLGVVVRLLRAELDGLAEELEGGLQLALLTARDALAVEAHAERRRHGLAALKVGDRGVVIAQDLVRPAAPEEESLGLIAALHGAVEVVHGLPGLPLVDPREALQIPESTALRQDLQARSDQGHRLGGGCARRSLRRQRGDDDCAVGCPDGRCGRRAPCIRYS